MKQVIGSIQRCVQVHIQVQIRGGDSAALSILVNFGVALVGIFLRGGELFCLEEGNRADLRRFDRLRTQRADFQEGIGLTRRCAHSIARFPRLFIRWSRRRFVHGLDKACSPLHGHDPAPRIHVSCQETFPDPQFPQPAIPPQPSIPHRDFFGASASSVSPKHP